jgi:hypothetical protein
MAHVRDGEPRVERGVVEVHDVIAGQREQALHAGAGERLRDDIRATKTVCHASSLIDTCPHPTFPHGGGRG